ncbi:hypothetical protein SVIO_086550 [Streptomyces violaceusniger]|uniref:Uncharacterized protein n=1 Tax=Streptomyces violaceusniger TaxID=68280 RepID=A0A4D4L9Y5_STRVO|nr:hypothetical protein SVIO_086550 [Streptomyces violaceusniger]
MLINHDTRCALDAVVDLVNTAPEGADRDDLADVAALRRFVERNDISDIGTLGERDLTAVRAVRARFAEVFAAAGNEGAAHRTAELLNAMIAAAGTTPRLTDHDGYDWHVHYFAPGASLADHLAADGGMALAFLVVGASGNGCAAVRPRTAATPSWTCPATAPGATATAAPAATGCMSRPTAPGAARPRADRPRTAVGGRAGRLTIGSRAGHLTTGSRAGRLTIGNRTGRRLTTGGGRGRRSRRAGCR